MNQTQLYDEPPKEAHGDEDQRFNQFWKEYPRRASKAAARKAWDKLKPSDELFSQIITAVKFQKQTDQWQKDNGKYIPHPATWLNGQRWEDDVAHEDADDVIRTIGFNEVSKERQAEMRKVVGWS